MACKGKRLLVKKKRMGPLCRGFLFLSRKGGWCEMVWIIRGGNQERQPKGVVGFHFLFYVGRS